MACTIAQTVIAPSARQRTTRTTVSDTKGMFGLVWPKFTFKFDFKVKIDVRKGWGCPNRVYGRADEPKTKQRPIPQLHFGQNVRTP